MVGGEREEGEGGRRDSGENGRSKKEEKKGGSKQEGGSVGWSKPPHIRIWSQP